MSVRRVVCLLPVAVLLAGCTPKVSYRQAVSGQDNPADPPAKTAVFALAQSKLLLNPLPQDVIDGYAALQMPDNHKEHPLSPWVPCEAEPGHSVDAIDCLRRMEVKSVPRADPSAIYFATFENAEWDVTPLDGEPLLPATVALGYDHAAARTITRLGADAAVGAGIGGPWGAATAVVVDLIVAGSSITDKAFSELAFQQWLSKPVDDHLEKVRDQLCDDPRRAGLRESPQIRLPIQLDAIVASTRELPKCWKQFPQTDSSDVNGGWFYRLSYEQPPTAPEPSLVPVLYGKGETSKAVPTGTFVPRSQYFAAAAAAYKPLPSTWPASACRALTLQVVWWRQLHLAYGDPKNPWTKSITVADPRVVQVTRVTKEARVITLGKVCGAYASASAQPDSQSGMEALIAESKALNDALKDYKDK